MPEEGQRQLIGIDWDWIVSSMRSFALRIRKMSSTIALRWDIEPSPNQSDASQKDVTIYAPDWVKAALIQLQQSLTGKKFQIVMNGTKKGQILKEFQITDTEPISLKQLQLMARNERLNTSGQIAFQAYEKNISKEVIFSLKDLTRQCVLVGKDRTTYYGGYPKRFEKVKQEVDVYIVDLIGLQFQEDYNSGRLVIYKESLPIGMLDQVIFTNVVGEPRKTFRQVKQIVEKKEQGARYITRKCSRSGSTEYFDTVAYQRFVASDVVLTAKALYDFANEPVQLKFLKYGTGFFAGDYGKILNDHILSGVLLGLETVLREDSKKIIQSLEFTFYNELEGMELERLKNLGLPYRFSRDDALMKHQSLINAVTNCADPHVALGNEMGYGSVDAAIAENLLSKGYQFSPALNNQMKEKFIEVKF